MVRSKLTLETARKKWATQSANLALLLGERIKLIYRCSLEAEQLRMQPNGPSEKDIRSAFSGIFTNPQNEKTINPKAVHSYMRFHRLSPKVVDVIAKHASGDGGHSVGLSYAFVLAEVKCHQIQMEILRSAIDGKWSVRELRKKARLLRDVKLINTESRHMVAVGKLEAAAIRFRDEIAELLDADVFMETIDKSYYRSEAESNRLIERIGNVNALLDDVVPKISKASDILNLAAAKVLEADK